MMPQYDAVLMWLWQSNSEGHCCSWREAEHRSLSVPMPGSPQPNLHNTHPPATHGAPLKGAYSIKEHSRRKQNLFQNDSRSILESLKYYEGNECIVSQNILRSILFSLPSTASTHCDCCLSFLPRFFFFSLSVKFHQSSCFCLTCSPLSSCCFWIQSQNTATMQTNRDPSWKRVEGRGHIRPQRNHI